MSHECVDCNRSFDTMHAIECHCSAKGHSQYECDVCTNGRKFKNGHALEQVTNLRLISSTSPNPYRSIHSTKRLPTLSAMNVMNGSKMTMREMRYVSLAMLSPTASDFPLKALSELSRRYVLPKVRPVLQRQSCQGTGEVESTSVISLLFVFAQHI